MLTRRRTVGVFAALVLALAAALPGAAPAAARAPGASCPPTQTNCGVWDGGGGNSGGGNNGGGNNGGNNGGGGDRTCHRGDEVVPCYDPLLGWFNQGDGCYYKVSEPQPADVKPGYTNYTRSCYGATDTVDLADPPAGFDPPDPEEMAYDLLARLNRTKPAVHVAPDPENGPGLVGLPVWLWTDRGAFPTARRPLRAQASEAGVTVRIEAYVTHIDWDMGNGAPPIRCNSRGTPYTGGGGRSPDCGYAGYPKSSGDGSYTITATSYWQVPWFVNGTRRGTLTPDPLRLTDTIEIDELQVVTE